MTASVTYLLTQKGPHSTTVRLRFPLVFVKTHMSPRSLTLPDGKIVPVDNIVFINVIEDDSWERNAVKEFEKGTTRYIHH